MEELVRAKQRSEKHRVHREDRCGLLQQEASDLALVATLLTSSGEHGIPTLLLSNNLSLLEAVIKAVYTDVVLLKKVELGMNRGRSVAKF